MVVRLPSDRYSSKICNDLDLGTYGQHCYTTVAVENGQSDGVFVSVDQNWINASMEVDSGAQLIKHMMYGA